MSVPLEQVKVSSRSTWSQRLFIIGLLVGFCYWAQGVVMTLVVATLFAYFLDPFVEWLERLRLPRALGALIVLLGSLAVLGAIGWTVVVRLDAFGRDWPKYRLPLRMAASSFEQRVERLEARVQELTPQTRDHTVIEVTERHPVRNALFTRLGSFYSVVVGATFVPFLVFFMLAAKRQVWHATMQLFPVTQRNRVKLMLEDLSATLRSFVIGNALVALILAVASWIFFAILGLDYALMIGVVSAVLSLVPYLGVVLAWVPPLIVALPKYHHAATYVAIFGVLTGFHLFGMNVLIPALVGRKVRLNALAVTIALLFWGWLWGGIGLILAIPITASIRVVCDHVEGLQPVGRWLSA